MHLATAILTEEKQIMVIKEQLWTKFATAIFPAECTATFYFTYYNWLLGFKRRNTSHLPLTFHSNMNSKMFSWSWENAFWGKIFNFINTSEKKKSERKSPPPEFAHKRLVGKIKSKFGHHFLIVMFSFQSLDLSHWTEMRHADDQLSIWERNVSATFCSLLLMTGTEPCNYRMTLKYGCTKGNIRMSSDLIVDWRDTLGRWGVAEILDGCRYWQPVNASALLWHRKLSLAKMEYLDSLRLLISLLWHAVLPTGTSWLPTCPMLHSNFHAILSSKRSKTKVDWGANEAMSCLQ